MYLIFLTLLLCNFLLVYIKLLKLLSFVFQLYFQNLAQYFSFLNFIYKITIFFYYILE